MILTYKYRIRGERSARLLRHHNWAINQAWNFCVETQKETQRRWRHGQGGSNVWKSPYDLQKLCGGSSKLLGIHAQSINSVCERFVISRDQHKVCPKFRKSVGSKRSLGWIPFQTQSRQIKPGAVTYLGHDFKFWGAKRRPLPKTVKGGCFSENSRGQWFVCLIVEVEQKPTGTGKIGIDLGLKTFASMSNGEVIENPRNYRKLEDKLAVAQRAHKNKRVKAIHVKIKNRRQDFLHKASAALAAENALIVVGNVSASKLAKTRMAKSVLDASWSTFREMLRYKASRHGAQYLEVDESFTTQTCSCCGTKPPGRPKGIAGLGIRSWGCSVCGVFHDRDVNAAQNILKIGLSVQPPVEGSRDSAVKQVAYGR